MIAEVPGIGLMQLEPSEFIDQRLLLFGVWEPAISQFIRDNIRPGATAIDIGANIGYDTVLMSRCVGLEGKVLAIEPSALIRERLQANIELNRLQNVQVIPHGLSDRSERRAFTTTRGNLGASHFGDVSSDGLDLYPLSDLIEPAELNKVSLIKIDVEGMEAPILRHIYGLLTLLPAEVIILVEIRMDPDIRDILTDFLSVGRSIVQIANSYALDFYLLHNRFIPLDFDLGSVGQFDLAILPVGVNYSVTRVT